MPKFSVMVNRTRTIEESYEVEDVTAKDEESAQAKVEAMVEKLTESGKLDDKFNFETTDVTEA